MKKVFDFIQTHSEEILFVDKILIFGSRARNDFTETSDYDLAFFFPPQFQKEWIRFKSFLSENAPTLNKLDLINMNDDLDDDFRKKILSQGKVLYEKQ